MILWHNEIKYVFLHHNKTRNSHVASIYDSEDGLTTEENV